MNNKDEITRWSGAIEIMIVLVFVCVNSLQRLGKRRQSRQLLQPRH